MSSRAKHWHKQKSSGDLQMTDFHNIALALRLSGSTFDFSIWRSPVGSCKRQSSDSVK